MCGFCDKAADFGKNATGAASAQALRQQAANRTGQTPREDAKCSPPYALFGCQPVLSQGGGVAALALGWNTEQH